MTPDQIARQREEFEAHYKRHHWKPCTRHPAVKDAYEDRDVHSLWEGWLARAESTEQVGGVAINGDGPCAKCLSIATSLRETASALRRQSVAHIAKAHIYRDYGQTAGKERSSAEEHDKVAGEYERGMHHSYLCTHPNCKRCGYTNTSSDSFVDGCSFCIPDSHPAPIPQQVEPEYVYLIHGAVVERPGGTSKIYNLDAVPPEDEKRAVIVYTRNKHPAPSAPAVPADNALREALEKIVRIPSRPWPEPATRGESNFSMAVYGAWRDINRIARVALTQNQAPEKGE